MINWMFFPQNKRVESHLLEIKDVFVSHSDEINSEENSLKSDDVLAALRQSLENIGYEVEKSKKKEDKIRVPVLFGKNGSDELAFEVDAYSNNLKTVIEVEAGRAVTNYQFLKDFYEACMMNDVEYFCVAVRNTYRKNGDFEKVCSFFETLYVSNRVKTPLKGVLVIGY